jgi:hypothetical protein
LSGFYVFIRAKEIPFPIDIAVQQLAVTFHATCKEQKCNGATNSFFSVDFKGEISLSNTNFSLFAVISMPDPKHQSCQCQTVPSFRAE